MKPNKEFIFMICAFVFSVVIVLSSKTVFEVNIPIGTMPSSNASSPTSQPYTPGLNVISLIIGIILGLIAIATTLADLFKRLLWKRKHGKIRTPIVMPHRSENQA